MAKIFISYRRADSNSESRQIYEALIERFGEKNIFRDKDRIPKGSDFRKTIEQYVFSSDEMLVLIGQKWLNIREDSDPSKRRLDNPEDFVRIEIDMGLRHVKHITPVVVQGAEMPSERVLPVRLAQLAFKNAYFLNPSTFDRDLNALVNDIAKRHRRPAWVQYGLGILAVLAVVGVLAIGLSSRDSRAGTPLATQNAQQTAIANAEREQTSIAQTQTAERLPSTTPTPVQAVTATPTPTVTQTPPVRPASTNTLTVDQQALATFAVTATYITERNNANATGTAKAVATASQVALEPTLKAQQTLDAIALATRVEFLKATLETWTPTPTSTFTPTLTPLTSALQRARTFTGAQNRDWNPFEYNMAGVTMILVPVGCFRMGDGTEAHQQCLDEPFWIDKYEVNNGQFTLLGGKAEKESRHTSIIMPRDNVTWAEAQAFCLLRGGRLPTEREWEYAARGVEGWLYPWGNTFNADNLVYMNNANHTAATVGSRPAGASWVGAVDMAGNLWEWTLSKLADYPYNHRDGRESLHNNGDRRILRGGSWQSYANLTQTAHRNNSFPSASSYNFGFRCVRPT